MQALFASAFGPPKQTRRSRRDGPLLPQQTEQELQLAESHTRLDDALKFLSGAVNYTLLGDVRLGPGGAAGLRPADGSATGRCRREACDAKKVPQGSATLAAGGREVQPLERSEGRDGPDYYPKELEAAKRNISPDAAKYAHYEEDLVLVTRFTDVLAENSPSAAAKVKNQSMYKLVLQGVRVLHLCDYDYADVVLVLAWSSVYFRDTFAQIGHTMSESEAAHVCVLLIYLAHSFVLDITCPLKCWQRFIFKKYCALKILDGALFRLFKKHDFRLMITKEEESAALVRLLGHSRMELAIKGREMLRCPEMDPAA